jgi:hypothetical protein
MRTGLGMLWPLGVEKGKEFKPSDKAQAAIAMAIPDVLAVLKNTLLNVGIRWWSDRRWRISCRGRSVIPGVMAASRAFQVCTRT